MTPARAAHRQAVRADREANSGYIKSRFVLRWFRACQRWRAESGPIARLVYLALAACYKLVTEWIMGIELPPSTPVGPGLRLRHGVSTVINPASTIGRGVLIRHAVTLGNRIAKDDCPVIEDNVELGVGAVVIGAIRIGRGARIGPYAVVTHDVPAGAVVYSPRPAVSEPHTSGAST